MHKTISFHSSIAFFLNCHLLKCKAQIIHMILLLYMRQRLASALLQKIVSHLSIIVFEKEDRLAAHQTGRNSGVIHSGLYYSPGSYRAKNCVNGRKQLVAFAKDHNIKHDVCGKVVVAVSEDELPRLDEIYKIGKANGWGLRK